MLGHAVSLGAAGVLRPAAFSLRLRSKALSSSRCKVLQRHAHGRRAVLSVSADGRFRSEEEQRAAIERLMPPSERGKANGGKKKPKFRKIPISDGSSGAGNGKSQQKFSNLPSPPRLNEDEQDPRDVAKRKRLERKESEAKDRLQVIIDNINNMCKYTAKDFAALPITEQGAYCDKLMEVLVKRGFNRAEVLFAMFKWYWSILEETEGQDMPPEGSEGVAGTPSTRSEWYAGAATDGKKGRSANGEGGGEQKPSGPLYDFGEWLRQWFAVDEIENEDGETEVYLSTTIEFTAALMLVIVFGSRAVNALAHYLVDAASGMGADPLM